MAGTNLMDFDLARTMTKCVANGGSLFYDVIPPGVVNATATGTGVSRTSITTAYAIPPPAKELLAWKPILAATADAAADSKFAMADIQGVAFKRQPQQVIMPTGSIILSVGAARMTPSEWFTIRAPVVAGDLYDYGCTPLVANTHNMKAGACLMYSTVPSGDPTIFSQVSAVTAFKTAGANSTGTLTLTAAAGLYEVATGVSTSNAPVAQENQILSHQLACSAMDPIQQIEYNSDIPAIIAATSGDQQQMETPRYPCWGLKFKIPNPILTYTSILDVATSNNLTVAHMARYTTF